jgi:hypothetical protein
MQASGRVLLDYKRQILVALGRTAAARFGSDVEVAHRAVAPKLACYGLCSL